MDVALARIKEIEGIQEKQKGLENGTALLKESLEFTHNSIKGLTKRVEMQKKALKPKTSSQ